MFAAVYCRRENSDAAIVAATHKLNEPITEELDAKFSLTVVSSPGNSEVATL